MEKVGKPEFIRGGKTWKKLLPALPYPPHLSYTKRAIYGHKSLVSKGGSVNRTLFSRTNRPNASAADFARKTGGFELLQLQRRWLISCNRNSQFKITDTRWHFINRTQPGTIL